MPIDRPWARVSIELGQQLRSGLDPVIEQVITAVSTQIPEYRDAADQVIPHLLRQGVQVALERLIDLLGSDQEALGAAASVYARIGVGEYRAGRPLQAVLAAYRIGATSTWRGLSQLALEAGADSAQTATLAEACFAYIDEISAVSAAGYAQAQSQDAARRDGLRAELARALLEGDAATAAAVAQQLRWPLPEEVVVAVWDAVDRPEPVVATRSGEQTVAVLPSGQAPRLLGRLSKFNPSVGTSQLLVNAHRSQEQALALHRLRQSGALDPIGVVHAEAHLARLVLAAEPDLTRQLRSTQLAPLTELTAAKRAVLVDTAVAWLLLGGARTEVAAWLHVHPQTVAYRMDRFRELFGVPLATVAGRWELLLALVAEQQSRSVDELPGSRPDTEPAG